MTKSSGTILDGESRPEGRGTGTVPRNSQVEQIRTFNRTVTRRLGVLNEKYLGRDRPLVESRLLFEIGVTGASVRELRTRLGLDSGFLSRLLRALERKGLMTTTQRSADDGRVRFARLTRTGMAELRRINTLSDELAQSMLVALTEEQGRRLVAAMAEVERLLRASGVEVTSEDPLSADAQQCLDRYFGELASRFRGGYDRDVDHSAEVGEFAPPKGCMLIARLLGEPVGCGAVRASEPGVAEIKRMWVAPQARGLGLGRRLLGELERVAARNKARVVRLDTNSALTEALQLYRSCGYREIQPFNDSPYAHHWFEKVLD
jgi:DNA-binding MarR family transcriptional regulator/GNAT superfamily N-acetyltransferase